MHANDREEMSEVFTGDIVAIVGSENRKDRRYAGTGKRTGIAGKN